jgi:hypothetical protein
LRDLPLDIVRNPREALTEPESRFADEDDETLERSRGKGDLEGNVGLAAGVGLMVVFSFAV